MRIIVLLYLIFIACGSIESRPHDDAGVASHDAGTDAPLRPASLSGSPATGTDFGDVVLGQSTRSSCMIINEGNLLTTPIAIALDNTTTGFAITDDSCSGRVLDHQQTCNFAVAFVPTTAGSVATTVHVTAALSDEVARGIAGNGLTPGAVSIVESGFAFGALGVDASPTSHMFVIQNTGQVALGVPSATLGGSNASSYGIASTTCMQMLAPNAECQVVVRFDPSAVGDKPASLTVTSSPGGSDSATLSGTGTARATISKTGTGAGVVRSNQTGIDCGTSCSSDFSSTPVTLTATPQADSTFDGWSNDCTGTGSCSLDLTRAKAVTAMFSAITPRLTVTLSGNGAGSVASSPAGISCGAVCMATFAFNTTVTLIATPQPGSTFTGWSGACSGASACALTMSQAQNVTANFAVNSYRLSAQALVGGSIGSTPAGINCGTTCSANFPFGTQVTLSGNPTVGWTFASWGGNAGCGTSSSCVFSMPAAAVTASAVFNPSLSVTINGGNSTGSVASAPGGINCSSGTCPATFAFDSTVTLTASSAQRSHVTWGSACSGSASTCAVRMNQLQSVTARFDLDPITLTVNLGGDGSGAVSGGGISCPGTCSNTYNQATTITLTASPAVGSQFDGWSGACAGSAATCTLTVGGATTVGATFSHDAGPTCGNGIVEPPERCDDGNTNDSDQCSSDCLHACTGGTIWCTCESSHCTTATLCDLECSR